MSSKVVLITGANSGVGYATTKVFATASDSYHIIMSSRSLEKVKAAQAEIESTDIKGSLSAIELDVTNEDSIQAAVDHVRNEHGRLDVLINNAAVGAVEDNLRSRFERSFATNVVGPARVAEAFRPLLLKSSNAYSIFVSSGVGSLERTTAGDFKVKNDDAYRMSKAALNMVMVVEHRDFKDQGLHVFGMCPGFVVSNIRGTSESARNPGGQAGDPMVSGETLLNIVEGKREADVGRVVHKDGVYAW